jgi:hypothetical protein
MFPYLPITMIASLIYPMPNTVIAHLVHNKLFVLLLSQQPLKTIPISNTNSIKVKKK